MTWLDLLKELKNKSGLTNAEIAQKSGISISSIAKIFAGIATNPSLDTIQCIVYSLGGTLDDIDPMGKDIDNKKSTAGEDDPQTVELATRLYDALVSSGRLNPGEDLTERQLKSLQALVGIIDGLFQKAD